MKMFFPDVTLGAYREIVEAVRMPSDCGPVVRFTLGTVHEGSGSTPCGRITRILPADVYATLRKKECELPLGAKYRALVEL